MGVFFCGAICELQGEKYGSKMNLNFNFFSGSIMLKDEKGR
jgi:hypothetical protein